MGHEKLETTPERSALMSKIRSKDTKPELLMRDGLEAIGFDYQPTDVPFKPDFAHKEFMTAVFIDGCFWHGCPHHYKAPKSNIEFWQKKYRRNARNDEKANETLVKDGWLVIRVWEHGISKHSVKDITDAIEHLLMAHTEKGLKVVRI